MTRLCLFLLLLIAPLAMAQAPLAEAAPVESGRDLSLYTVELPVTSQEARERQMALARGLAQVLTRLTGRLQVGDNPVVQRALRSAESLLVSSEYLEQPETAGGVPSFRQLLRASFQPESVDAIVAAAGLPAWPVDRSRPLLWLVIDDGRGPRLVTSQQLNVVRPLAQRGLEIGLRVLLPAGNSVETGAVAALQARDLAAASVLTGRYGQQAQLIGFMRRAPEGWQVDWRLGLGDAELASWSAVDANPQRVIASGADRAVEALALREARPAEPVVPETLRTQIRGIGNQADWLRVAALLQGSPLVQRHVIHGASAGSLDVTLDLVVSRAAFDRWLQGGAVLQPSADAYALRPRP